jgi:hypothetical protein
MANNISRMGLGLGIKKPFQRSGLGVNPLDEIVPTQTKTPKSKAKGAAAAIPVPAAQPRVKKERYTLNLPEDLIEQAKNAAWATRRPLTIIAEEGLRRELARLEKERGEPFPPRPGNLPAGRPLS